MDSTGANMCHTQSSKRNNQNIQVYVRVRPLNVREKYLRSIENVEVISQREVVTRHGPDAKLTKKFTFDRTFNSDSSQVDVYCAVVSPLIEEVLAGYNCTVFAYGQTGTGKTHTMVGNECVELKSSWEDNSEIGIIPRALCHLFDELRMRKVEFSMRISYLELYNEELCDLLSSDESTKIRIYDDNTKKGSVIIQGLEEIPVHSKDDVYKLLEKGKERRKTAATLMNAQSSRSHTVFSILVHMKENGIDGEEMLKIGKLNLVDLAGSENASKAGNEKGIRTRETVNINQSLLTLGRVITALVERTPHIPYRESKLTRLLQESLGGRTKTSIIATISPSHKDIEETLSTLEYAHRAKNIQNKPEVNQKLTKKIILKEYTEEIDKLKRDLMAARDKNGIYLAEETYTELNLKMESQNRELNEKMLLLKALKDELSSKEKIFNEVSLHLVQKTEKLNKTEENLKKTTGDLIKTKKFLHDTKRRYREKKVVIESHVETEKALKNQATKIMQVADIATQDANALHETIDRRKEMEVQIQAACEKFSESMCDNFDNFDANLRDLKYKQQNCSKEISLELGKISHSQTELSQNTKLKISEIDNLCDNFLKESSSLEGIFLNSFKEFSQEHQNTLLLALEEIRKKEQKFREDIKENLASLNLYNEQQKCTLNNMHQRIIERLKHNNTELKKHTETMNTKIDEIKHKSFDNLQELQRLRSNLNEEDVLMEEDETFIEELQKNVTSFVERILKKKKLAQIVRKNVKYLDSGEQDIVNTASNTAALNTEYIENQALELISECALLEQEVTNTQLNVDKSVAECSAINIQLDNKVQETFSQTHLISSDQAKYHKGLCEKTENRQNERADLHLDNCEKIKKTTVNISNSIDNSNEYLDNHIDVLIQNDLLLVESLENYVESFNKQMMECDRDINLFRQNECKMYKATGTTPKKKEFTYPRILAETSPHVRIVERFRQENNWSDMDTTLPIEEESEFCDDEDGILSVLD